MKNRLSTLFVICMLAASTALAGVEYVIKVSYPVGNLPPTESPDIMYGDVFKRECEERSNGRIAVEIYGSAQLGTLAEVIKGVMDGYIEATIMDNTMLNQHLPMTQVLTAPGVFLDMDECDAVLTAPWGEKYRKTVLDKLGIRIINQHCKGFRHFTTSTKELKTVDDARGVTFRVMESPVSIKMVEALGAKAVPMPSSEMYMAMRNGVVDGQENPISSFIQDKSYEVQKFMVLDGHIAGVVNFIVNEEFYQSLPDELKTVVEEAAAIGVKAAIEVSRDLDERGVDFIREKGLSVYKPTPEELSDWHRTVSGPTHEYIRNALPGGEMEELLRVVETVRGKH